MSTGAPPAYSAVPTKDPGEGATAPPPSYNAGAAKAPPPAYNASAVKVVQQQPKVMQQQPQPVIKYVDQNGNPVNIASQQQITQQPQPAANIRYVDQYGNPVAPPQQQVVQQPQAAANIRYVDQYGNPVAPPTQQPPTQKPSIKYVDQNGNPVAPPTTATTPGTNATKAETGTDTASQKQQKMGAAILAMLGGLLLFIGLCVNSLSSESYYDGSYDYRITCGFTSIRLRCDNSYYCDDSSSSYGDGCDLENDYGSSSDYSYCGTRTAGAISLVAMLIAFILNIVGIVYVQPWKKVNPSCCKTGNPPRANLGLSIIFSLISIISWMAGENVCNDYLDMSMGGTHICQIIAMILNLIACLLARK